MACAALDFSCELGEQPVVTTRLTFVIYELYTSPDPSCNDAPADLAPEVRRFADVLDENQACRAQ